MNDALEQRAHLHLLRLLTHERNHARRRQKAGLTPDDPDGERPRRLSSFESAVQTLHALGALSPEDAKSWRQRFEAACVEQEGERPVPDAQTRERVGSVVKALFDEQRAGRGEERAHSFRRSVFALEGVGAISREESYRWVDRICVEFGLPTRSEEEEEERGGARTCTALALRRVIAAPMAVGALQMTHLELYSDGALLYAREGGASPTCGADPRWANPFSEQKRESPLSVGDDLGTVYEVQQYHGFAKSLTPAVPDAASRLTVSYADAAGEISLR